MSDTPSGTSDTDRAPSAWLTPTAGAVASFAIAAATLTGQSQLTVGVEALLGRGIGGGGNAMDFYLSWALATLLATVLVVVLARPALRAGPGWDTTLARAAIVVTAVALLGSVLGLLGGLLHDSAF